MVQQRLLTGVLLAWLTLSFAGCHDDASDSTDATPSILRGVWW